MDRDPTTAFWTRYWLAFAIGATVAAACLLPGPALALPGLHVLDAGVVAVMFMGALKLSPGRFKEALQSPLLIALSAASAFFLAPVLSLGAAWLFGLSGPEDRIAVLICSAQASTLATGIVLTEIAGGAVALAMVLTLVNNTATVFLTPLVFRLWSGAAIAVDHLAMGREIALKIALPILVAQGARRWLAAFAERRARALSVSSQLIILIYIYAGVAAGLDHLTGRAAVLPRILGLVVCLHLALLAANALIARLATRSPGRRAAFVFCSSQKTLPAAMIVWKGYFPGLPLGPIVAVGYHLTQLVVDSMAAPGFMKLPLIRDGRASGATKRGESDA